MGRLSARWALAALVLAGLAGCGAAELEGPEGTTGIVDAFRSAVFFTTEPVLDFEDRPASPGSHAQLTLLEGWARPERRHVWAVGPRSVVSAYLPWLDAVSLEVECRPLDPVPGGPEPFIRLRLNGISGGTRALAAGWQVVNLPLPAEALRSGSNTIELEYAYHHPPSALGRGQDQRSLAVCFRRIGLVGSRPDDGSLDEDVAISVDRGSATVQVRAAARILVPLQLPPSARTLEMRLQTAAGAASSAPQVTLSIMDLEGAVTEVGVSSWQAGEDGTTADLSIPVRRWSGASVSLLIDVRPRASGVELSIGDPRVSTAADGRDRAPDATWQDPPDIVLVILDAARPDHMSCYGYERLTTPRIDELARESLVFPRAFAMAPYTRCSVPTILTGLSFLRHGVVGRDDYLDDDAVTIAELLGRVGYQTFGISAMPNHSTSLNLHQGYDEFVETWVGLPFEEGMEASRLTETAIARLDAASTDRPVFLLLHYLQPHEPYLPPPQHDIFGDSAYDGPLEPGWGTMAGRLKEMDLGPADVDRLVSLYDANLRTADAAVGRLLDHLRGRARWSRTVVLVVADHGEAFYEHGRLGHNTTVYDEVLSVPFILRLPAGRCPAPDVTRALVSLADVVPTLLAQAGLEVVTGLDGRNVVDRSGYVGLERALVLRDGHARPTFGVRTARWKAVFAAGRPPQLYDLAQDPEEQIDVAIHHPLVVASLRAMLEDERRRVEGLGTLAASGTLGEDQRQLLEALGYS
jgi:arylsulfatase A-like enzyme